MISSYMLGRVNTIEWPVVIVYENFEFDVKIMIQVEYFDMIYGTTC